MQNKRSGQERRGHAPVRKSAGRRVALWAAGAVAIFVVAAVALVAPLLLSHSASSAVIKIPRGATSRTVSDSLSKYFGPDYAAKVMRVMTDDEETLALRYGAYEIKEGTSALMAAKTLSRGAETPFNIVINGVRDLDGFLPRIAARFDFPADSLRAVLYSPATLAKYGLDDKRQAPALFLNDTYSFFWTASPEKVVEKIADNYSGFWTEARVAQARALGLSPEEVVVIASIVDEETNLESEKGRIGRLYVNRLQKGMRLQADPTVRYALGDFTIRRVTGEHLKVDSPYNTYRINGLPPGPIRTTSKSTIDAVLQSPESEDLYMCAKEDFSGAHNFASDYASHQANARRYQEALDARGIKK